MSKSILQLLFDGKIYPSENIGVSNPDVHEANSRLNDAKTDFSKGMSDSERDDFNKLDDLYYKSAGVYNYESFAHGFKLGVALMLEVMSDTDSLFRNSNN